MPVFPVGHWKQKKNGAVFTSMQALETPQGLCWQRFLPITYIIQSKDHFTAMEVHLRPDEQRKSVGSNI